MQFHHVIYFEPKWVKASEQVSVVYECVCVGQIEHLIVSHLFFSFLCKYQTFVDSLCDEMWEFYLQT